MAASQRGRHLAPLNKGAREKKEVLPWVPWGMNQPYADGTKSEVNFLSSFDHRHLDHVSAQWDALRYIYREASHAGQREMA